MCEESAFVERVERVAENHHTLIRANLCNGCLPVIHEKTLFGLFRSGVILVVLEIGAPVRHCTVRTVIGVIGAGRPDLITIGKIQIDLTGSRNWRTAITKELRDGVAHAIRRIIIIIIPGHTDVPSGQLVDHVALGANRELLCQAVVLDIREPRGLENILDWVAAIIENNPFHAILGVCLCLETGDGDLQKHAAIVRGR